MRWAHLIAWTFEHGHRAVCGGGLFEVEVDPEKHVVDDAFVDDLHVNRANTRDNGGETVRRLITDGGGGGGTFWATVRMLETSVNVILFISTYRYDSVLLVCSIDESAHLPQMTWPHSNT